MTADSEIVVRPLAVECPDESGTGYHRSGFRFLVGDQPVNRFKRQMNFDPNTGLYSPDVDLPWTCRCNYRLVDLGENVIPRYVTDAECVSGSCWYGHYYCLPIETQQTVLVGHSLNCVDRRLPVDLRNKYVLQTISVKAGCRCGRR